MKTRLTRTAAAVLFSLATACGLPPEADSQVGSVEQGLVSAPPSLGAAAGFAVLGASTVTCTNASSVTGDVGVAPGTAITGFNPDCTLTGAIHAGDAVAAQAHNDLLTAYNNLDAIACEHNLTGADLGGMTLAPGVYCFDSSVGLTGELTLDGGGDANAVWVFQIASTLTTASNSAVVMAGSGKPCNVFWQVGSSATLGTNTAFQGNVVAFASITLTTGTSLAGRALALNAAVTMDQNVVSLCTGGSTGNPGNPGPTCRSRDWVTGGGFIKDNGPKKTFAISGGIKRSAFWGHFTFQDHAANGLKVQSQSITGYVALDATTRRISGTAKVNGQPGFGFEVIVSDNGEPGRNDTFSMVLSNGSTASGLLTGGNIQLHQRAAGQCGGNDDGDDGDHGGGSGGSGGHGGSGGRGGSGDHGPRGNGGSGGSGNGGSCGRNNGH
ncbi:MAG: ice-binding family protein [Archangium sp.]|nr:ice-binding family protein [Archangium sp.]